MCLVSYIEFRPFCHRWGKNNNSASYITGWNDILKSLDFGMGWEAEAFNPTIKWLSNQYVFNWKPQQKEQTSVTTFSRVLLKRMKASIKSLASSASLFLQHAKKSPTLWITSSERFHLIWLPFIRSLSMSNFSLYSE